MLAMDFIKSNRADVERAIRDKGVDVDLDALLTLEAEARALKTEIDTLRASRISHDSCTRSRRRDCARPYFPDRAQACARTLD